MSLLFDFFAEYIISYFKEKGWSKNICRKCGTIFLSKRNEDCCEKATCKVNAYETIKNKRKKIDWTQFNIVINDFFSRKGYTKKSLPNVYNKASGDTAYVVAALQLYNNDLMHGNRLSELKIYNPQACIRLNDFSESLFQVGFLHSFVNVATLKINANIIDYCTFLDDWISFLSLIGIHASRLKIVLVNSYVNIKNIYYGWGCDITLDGLELGCCNYYDKIVSSNMREYTGIDCGFSIERLFWCANGGEFWDGLLPADLKICPSKVDYINEDTLRTIVLIVMSGIVPGAQNVKYHLKKMLTILLKRNYNIVLLEQNIDYYYDYWKNYLEVRVPLIECKKLIFNYFRDAYFNQ